MIFSRTDNSVISRWWWTVDRWLLALIFILMCTGLWLILTASPAVAERIGLESYHFVKRQLVFLTMGLITVVGISLMPRIWVRRIAIVGFPITLALIILTLFIGPEIKGAHRWIQLPGFTLQPSEFMKPMFIVTVGWLLSAGFDDTKIPAKRMAMVIFVIVVGLLVLQPDFGQAMLVSMVFIGMLTIAGMPLLWVISAGLAGVFGVGMGYLFLPHVSSRIDRFLDPSKGDNFQTEKSLEAFQSGGLLGRGPGEGVVKLNLPDAHTDYIFAVLGEEFGAIACVMLLLLFVSIVVRGLSNLLEEEDPFSVLAVSGLLMQFGFQALINIGVNLSLLPAKGMTLPFISYGGSSMLALAIGMGMVLSLTRHNRFLRKENRTDSWGGDQWNDSLNEGGT